MLPAFEAYLSRGVRYVVESSRIARRLFPGLRCLFVAMVLSSILVNWPVYCLAGNLHLREMEFTKQDGIGSTYIYDIVQDDCGYLYFQTRRGSYFYTGKYFAPLPLPVERTDRPAFSSTNISSDGYLYFQDNKSLFLARQKTSARVSPLDIEYQKISVEGAQGDFLAYYDRRNIFILEKEGLRRCFLEQGYQAHCEVNLTLESEKLSVAKIGRKLVIVDSNRNTIFDTDGHVLYSLGAEGGFIGRTELRKIIPVVFLREKRLRFLDDSFRWRDLPYKELKNDVPGRKEIYSLMRDRNSFLFYDGHKISSYTGKGWDVLNDDFNREQDIFSSFLDRDHQFWSVRDEVDLIRFIGWGNLENLVSSQFETVWYIRQLGDAQILSADRSLYYRRGSGAEKKLVELSSVAFTWDGPSYFWISPSREYVARCKIVESRLLCDKRVTVRDATQLARVSAGPRAGQLWIATLHGLFSWGGEGARNNGKGSFTSRKRFEGEIDFLTLRGGRDLWFATRKGLYRLDGNGTPVHMLASWPSGPNFWAVSMAFTSENDLWIGGVGTRTGLIHIRLSGNRIVSIESVSSDKIGSEMVFTLFCDSRHWLWVGSESMLAGYNGKEWVRIDKDDGLVSTDISARGITEDRDGSLWVGSSRGATHLRHPEHYFQYQDLRPVFVRVMLGDKPLPEKAVPFTHESLSVKLGTLNTELSATTQFRYRMEGVDSQWIGSSTGEIRYNYVPAGHSRLFVEAVNDKRNLISAPIVLDIRMQRPWWQAWPLIVLYVVAIPVLPYTLNRLRFRYLMKRQRVLETLVDERTREMQAAQKALEQQARQDGLTRLMNRRTAEASARRLMETMASRNGKERPATGPDAAMAALALFDIDYFKSINDSFGHTIGDEILVEIGARLLREKKGTEIVGRYGGEEFLILVAGPFPDAVARISELLATLSGVAFETRAGTMPIGCSAGITDTWPGDVWSDAIERADKALYEAKLGGRGRIVVSESGRDDEGCPG